MSSVVRSVLGVALLLTGASAVMAQSAKPPVADQSRQTGAVTGAVAANNAPVAGKSVQTGAATAVAAPNAAAADQPRKRSPSVPDNNAPFDGNDPNSTAAARAFFVPQY